MEENIGQQINEAITNAAAENNYADVERERLEVEKQRIKSEERIAARMAERDENVAGIEHDTNYYRTMLDELFNKLDNFFGSTTPTNQIPQTIEINSGDVEKPEPASEDASENNSPVEESIEEIGENEAELNPLEANPQEEENGNSRRRRKRGRR